MTENQYVPFLKPRKRIKLNERPQSKRKQAKPWKEIRVEKKQESE